MNIRLGFIVVVVAALGSPAHGDVVLDWNSVTLQAVRTGFTPPPRASRAFAMVHAAVYDAVNSIDGTHQPYLGSFPIQPGCSREAAAAQSAHDVLVGLFPAQTSTFNAALDASLAGIPDGPAKTDGIALGAVVASNMLAVRAGDGSDLNPPYIPGMNPGDWRPTPPGYAPALLPGWGNVTPFALPSGSHFRPPAPPDLTSAQYTAAYDEVKELGAIDSPTRTADQTEIARFWADGGGTETPPGHWNTIARMVSVQEGLDLSENARLFALLNLATADSGIAAWDAKYAYNHWRPITGIREGDTDSNPDTIADPTWTPLLTTPPFPAYVSGHSTFSAASARVLAEFFETDSIAFTTGSDGLPGVFRSFAGFSDAADEAGVSRIYGGIHWQYDNTMGMALGDSIGGLVFDNFLLPIPEPSSLVLTGLVGVLLIRRRRRASAHRLPFTSRSDVKGGGRA